VWLDVERGKGGITQNGGSFFSGARRKLPFTILFPREEGVEGEIDKGLAARRGEETGGNFSLEGGMGFNSASRRDPCTETHDPTELLRLDHIVAAGHRPKPSG
jgi:hypothetical protein